MVVTTGNVVAGSVDVAGIVVVVWGWVVVVVVAWVVVVVVVVELVVVVVVVVCLMFPNFTVDVRPCSMGICWGLSVVFRQPEGTSSQTA